MRGKLLKAATLSFFFLQLPALVHAQAPSSARPEARSRLSEITHDFSTWLSHVTGTTANHHRAAPSPPLPRSRPAELARAPVASNDEPSELAPAPALNKQPSEAASTPVTPKKKTPAPVLIND